MTISRGRHFLLCLLAAVGCHAATVPLVLTKSIPLPKVTGRIDHMAIDGPGQRLFVCALGHDSLEVVDLAGGRVLASLDGFAEPQGVVYVPELNRLFVGNGRDGTLCILDGSSFSTRAIVPLGDDADNVRYDTAHRRIFVGYGEGGLAAIGAASDRAIARIPLAAHPEAFQLETNGPRLFVNVPDAHQVVVVDRVAQQVVATWRLTAAGGNFPLALDEPGHRLFLGCRSPARLVVLSTDDGRVVAQTTLHRDCDDVFFDAARHRLYASCGEGFIDVFTVGEGPAVARSDSVATAPGARTSFFDGDCLYLAVPRHGDRDAEIRVYAVR